MGSMYDQQQVSGLNQILQEARKESKKTTAILIISLLALLVAIVGLVIQ